MHEKSAPIVHARFQSVRLWCRLMAYGSKFCGTVLKKRCVKALGFQLIPCFAIILFIYLFLIYRSLIIIHFSKYKGGFMIHRDQIQPRSFSFMTDIDYLISFCFVFVLFYIFNLVFLKIWKQFPKESWLPVFRLYTRLPTIFFWDETWKKLLSLKIRLIWYLTNDFSELGTAVCAGKREALCSSAWMLWLLFFQVSLMTF